MFFHDKKNNPFEVIRPGGESDASGLLEMYETFKPKGKFQGLPPLKEKACLAWIHHLFESGENHLAIRNHRTIGHAVLLPDLALRDGEYLVFVHQQHRGLGVGTQLTDSALEYARSLGLTLIWLTVDASNFVAIRLYRKFGFCFCDKTGFHCERKMMLSLGGDCGQC
jgi:GNAT superfamily N-acetyltransferase